MHHHLLIAVALPWIFSTSVAQADADMRIRKIVLVAGTKSHGPGHHEYEKGLRLLQHCLTTSPNLKGIRAEVYCNGWPEDPKVLDDAASIVVFSDGSDQREQDHPLLRPDRLEQMDRLMKRGVGLVALHYTVFVPSQRAGAQFLEWLGGYFDYENGPPPRRWYSQITTASTRPEPATPTHPICRGITPFSLTEEYYYHLRFRPNDPRRVPILTTPIPPASSPEVVAWAVERAGGGRGFGFTGGHFHSNWGVENFRKLVLNAIAWTAHAEVPAGGVASTLPPDFPETFVPADKPAVAGPEPIRALIFTGHNGPFHDWRATTQALREVLTQDTRFVLKTLEQPELLGRENLLDYDLLVQNYVNWQRPGLDEASKAQLLKFVRAGRGLAFVHFANGAFLDWPEYRSLCRRVWIDGKSGHDAFGPFRVEIADPAHPITRLLQPFDTVDELYFRQQGDRPIHVLATARSRVTGQKEPMAFVYTEGNSRVFQTVLGHDANAIRMPGPNALIRRGCVWAAGKEQVPSEPGRPATERAPGRFGQALDPRREHIEAPYQPGYQRPPLTVECWTRLDSTTGFNLLVANGSKESATHWEIYTTAGTGSFSAYLPGSVPAVIDSAHKIVDGHWHHVGMVYEPNRLRLFIDGRMATDVVLRGAGKPGMPGPLYFGAYPPQGLGCDGLIDDVRIRRGAHPLTEMPQAPLRSDHETIGLWSFDVAASGRYRDASPLHNAAGRPLPPASGPLPGATYHLPDPSLRLVRIDQSPTESFLSLALDTMGRLFVGGREALFVYEPERNGLYQPRQELCRFPPDSWIAGVAIRGNDLYIMTSSALYRLAGARTKRSGLVPERLIWGLPLDLHVSYHSLAWGPEGDLYFCSGDPLLNYGDFQRRPDHWGHWTIFTPPTGNRIPYTGVGGIFRCRPDGTGFQVVAGGTRGAFGLVFDRHWNLFANDNDHESLPARYVPARLLHVTPNADFAWPRGWIASMTPERADLVETMTTALGREVPVGQAYYDEPLLPPTYRNTLLLARWGQRRIDSFVLEPAGASFRALEQPLLVGEEVARPVGVAVGRGGRIFAAISHMKSNEWSPRYPSDLIMITTAADTPAAPFAAYDAPTAPAARLWQELAEPACQRRAAAHVELMRRGGPVLAEAIDRLRQTPADGPAYLHLVWLAASSGQPEAARALLLLANHSDEAIRRTALQALGEYTALAAPRELFVRALTDRSPAVQLAAIEALRSRPGSVPAALISGPASSSDLQLRQAATRYLSAQASLSELDALTNAADTRKRLAGVLAAGIRLTQPATVAPVPKPLPLPYTVANAKFIIRYADAEIDLRQLGPVGSFTAAERWRLCPRSEQDQALFTMLLRRLKDVDDRVSEPAGYFLSLLDDPRSEPIIAATTQDRSLRRFSRLPAQHLERAWMAGPFPDPKNAAAHPPERGAIDLAATYRAGDRVIGWQEVEGRHGFTLSSLAGGAVPATTYFYFRLQSNARQPVLLELSSDPALAVATSGSLASQDPSVPGASPRDLGNGLGQRCRVWLNGRLSELPAPVRLELEPGSNDVLIRVATKAAERLLVAYRAAMPTSASLPERVGLGDLAGRLRSAARDPAAAVPPALLALDWNRLANKGDPERGRKLFGRDGLGCAKCHAIFPGQAGGGGPSLAGASQRFTLAHLVESILLPSKQVAPIYYSTLLVTKNGEIVSGLVVGETNGRVELLLPDASRRFIETSAIESRKLQETSPMPAGLVKTPGELSDLLSYLLQANPVPP